MGSSIIKKSDFLTPKQVGNNGNVEYTWSTNTNIREKILQFSFQLVRTTEKQMEKLEEILRDILQNLKQSEKSDETVAYLSLMYRLIGYTRDIMYGKGEYYLTYMMIYVWYDYYPELSIFALKCLISTNDSHPYGSWKDMKRMCDYCHKRRQYKLINHPLIDVCIQLINDQLRNDKEMIENNPFNISLVSKWIPREKSAYGWLFTLLAENYFYFYVEPVKDMQPIYKKALKKCMTEYRKIVSSLNKKLDTLQIKQCSNKWAEIDFNNLTSISLLKQKEAFLNIKNGKERFPKNEDRNTCSENFSHFIKSNIESGKEINGRHIGMEIFTSHALKLLKNPNQVEIDLLNSQWRDNSSQNCPLGKMIAMVDVSASMNGSSMHASIALGIRVAEKSILGKRVMTFSSTPTWINLSKYDNFVEQVDAIHNSVCGMDTNFYTALKIILDAIIESNMPPEEVQDLMLVIFSDMQINHADKINTDILYENIKNMYSEAGIKSEYRKPYKPPHLLFWNLRSTSGFPALSNQSNVSMMSGFNPSLLNLFCNQGIYALQSCNPWSQLERSLNNKRYDIMKDFLLQTI
jgi:hypothetical protein